MFIPQDLSHVMDCNPGAIGSTLPPCVYINHFFILLNVMASQTQHSLVSGLILEIGSKMSGKKSGFDVYTICLS
jgi:hypothetical protein